MSTQFDTQNTHNDDTYGYGQPAAGRRASRLGGNPPRDTGSRSSSSAPSSPPS